MESARNKMQKVLQLASEHRQRVYRISYIALVLQILILTGMSSCYLGLCSMARPRLILCLTLQQ